MSTTDRLKVHARDRADHPAIEEGQQSLTYRELDAAVDNAAANLQAAGIGVGDTVAVILPDDTDHLIVLCALARVGAVLFPFDVAMRPEEVAARLMPFPVKAIVQATPGDAIAGLVPLSVGELRQPASRSFVAPELDGGDPVALVQSSGTTGTPKTILRSHAEKQEWVSRIIPIQGWSQDERCLSLLPFCFATGRNVCLAVLELGATLVIDHPGSCEALVATIDERRITYLRLTPSFLQPLLDYAADKAPLLPNLRGIGIGSAPVTALQRRAARQSLNPNFIVFYGCNEAGCLATATPADQDAHPDAVGRLMPGVEAEVLDDNDQPLGFGEVGLIRFRGPGIASGYLDDPEASAKAFRDGWFYPLDLAALDEDGYVFLKGRADDAISNSGVLFYPSEVETALESHPAVGEATVFGWPHPKTGEAAVAVVVTKAAVSARALRAYCAERIAPYKMPWRIMFLDELPKDALGKIQKRELKQRFGERLEEQRQRAASAPTITVRADS